ncbi:beta-lactamase-like protein [Astrocystis sublimbata]|nr:beta-lactamase-like protein [Astrocystis sublimbata]
MMNIIQPRSNSRQAVQVRVIDTKTLIYVEPTLFFQPKIEGFEGYHAPIYCFLISHGDRHVLFDLGVRTDWRNYAPSVVSLIEATTVVTVGSDVASILDSGASRLGISRADIESVIWSHNHFDHVGDITTFPSSTELVVGPGVCAASWPGWPQVQDAKVLEADRHGRRVREIAFDGTTRFGSFEAFDFFGDGSFYLLNAPGHATGHLCAAARCTADPPSFVFMGADACHHPGVLRPTEKLPLPHPHPQPSPQADNIETRKGESTKQYNSGWCPGALLEQLTLDGTSRTPFQEVAKGPLFPDHNAATETVRKIQELDATDNIFVIIAHDVSLSTRISFFPDTINDWMTMGLKMSTRWLFCTDYSDAVKRLEGKASEVLGEGKGAL